MRVLICLSLLLATPVLAEEPLPYCQVSYFKNSELKTDTHGLNRFHAFRIGQVTLAGLSVGGSSDDKGKRVMAISQKLAEGGGSLDWKNKKGCVYYTTEEVRQRLRGADHDLAHTDDDTFNEIQIHHPDMDLVDEPLSLTRSELPRMLSCLKEQHFLAIGCNGMKHRGPTEFGLMLSLAGCKPEESLAIVKEYWGHYAWGSKVPDEVRLGVFKTSFEYGAAEGKESRDTLQNLFAPSSGGATPLLKTAQQPF